MEILGMKGIFLLRWKNITDQEVVLEVGERVVQAVFAPFLIADGDAADGVRLVDLDRLGTRMKIIFDVMESQITVS